MWKMTFLRGTALLALVVTVVPRVAQEQTATGATPSALTAQGPGAQAHTIVMADLPQVTSPTTSKTATSEPLHDDDYGPAGGTTQPGVGPTIVPSEPSQVPIALLEETTPTATTMFLGQDQEACGGGGPLPPDHALATSQATSNPYVVQVLNYCIAVYNNSGTLYSGFPKSLNSFFGVTSTDLVGDVRALYDQLWNHFIVAADDFSNNTILLAASATWNPTGTWNIYVFPASAYGMGGYADNPMLGQTELEIGDTKGGIYVSYDEFSSTDAFMDDVVLILPKSPIYAGTPTGTINQVYGFNSGVNVDHVHPANVSNRADRPRAEFLINTFNYNLDCLYPSACNGLVVWAIYNGVWFSGTTGPNTSGASISTANNYYTPINAGQPGAAPGSTCAIGISGRVAIMGQVTWSAGDLFAAITTRALNGQKSDGWLYWQVHPYLSDDTPPVIHGGTNNPAPLPVIRNEVCWGCAGFGNSTFSEFQPTPQPDDEGHVTIVFNVSDFSTTFGTIYPSTGYISARTTQEPGTFYGKSLYLTSGSATYCQLNSGVNHWGDYTAASPLGSTATYPGFWFAGQFSESSTSACSTLLSTPCWGTAIGKNAYTSETQP
jgi:hypothetical protein